jgi:hypothetical protein
MIVLRTKACRLPAAFATIGIALFSIQQEFATATESISSSLSHGPILPSSTLSSAERSSTNSDSSVIRREADIIPSESDSVDTDSVEHSDPASLRVLAEEKKGKKESDADASKENVHLAAWGEADYWLKLEDLRFSEGELDPEFNPEWAGPYDLLISSPAATSLVVKPMLNVKK